MVTSRWPIPAGHCVVWLVSSFCAACTISQGLSINHVFFYHKKKLVFLINLTCFSGQCLFILFLQTAFLNHGCLQIWGKKNKTGKSGNWDSNSIWQTILLQCYPFFHTKKLDYYNAWKPGTTSWRPSSVKSLKQTLAFLFYGLFLLQVETPLNHTKQQRFLQNYRGDSVHPSWQGIPGLNCPRRMELCQEVIIFNIIQK